MIVEAFVSPWIPAKWFSVRGRSWLLQLLLYSRTLCLTFRVNYSEFTYCAQENRHTIYKQRTSYFNMLISSYFGTELHLVFHSIMFRKSPVCVFFCYFHSLSSPNGNTFSPLITKIITKIAFNLIIYSIKILFLIKITLFFIFKFIFY